MVFRELYKNIKQHLEKCVSGKTVSFTHRGFYGYRFEIKAVKERESNNA